MVSIDGELVAIKQDPLEFLDSTRIIEFAGGWDYWPEADGKLDPPTLLALFYAADRRRQCLLRRGSPAGASSAFTPQAIVRLGCVCRWR